MTYVSGWTGFPPVIKIETDHRAIYEKLWGEVPDYRNVSPGEDSVPTFLAVASPKHGTTVIDFGCGTGRASKKLHESGLFVEALDFTSNCLDPEVRALVDSESGVRFTQHDLTKPIDVRAEYGFCSDVLEHIPEDKVPDVLSNILMAARYCFLVICTEPDHFGEAVGHTLHLTVRDKDWWTGQLEVFGFKASWSDETPGSCAFYGSAWIDGQEVVDAQILNIGDETVRENVRTNTTGAKYRQVEAYQRQEDTEVIILGGAPSLNDHIDEIRERREAGAKLVTLNNAYTWALEHGLKPSATVMVDARPFNARFVKPVIDDCLYLIASQCDPSVYEGLPVERIWQWHTMSEQVGDILNETLPQWMSIPGGSTVLLRAIPLLMTLGYAKFHLYGADSCLKDDAHHAYSQPENDTEVVIPISCGGRIFRCHPWMSAQAQEWITLIQKLGEGFDCQVHGDGLLAHIVNTASNIEEIR